MKKIVRRQRPSLLLLWLTCVLMFSGCASTGPVAKPEHCPKPQPAPSNVMRLPSYEQRLRELLFESGEMPTTSSERVKP